MPLSIVISTKTAYFSSKIYLQKQACALQENRFLCALSYLLPSYAKVGLSVCLRWTNLAKNVHFHLNKYNSRAQSANKQQWLSIMLDCINKRRLRSGVQNN